MAVKRQKIQYELAFAAVGEGEAFDPADVRDETVIAKQKTESPAAEIPGL